MFDFETDEDSVTLHKYEESMTSSERVVMGSVLLYADQIDEVIKHLQRLKSTLGE